MGMQLRMCCQELFIGEIFAEKCSGSRTHRIERALWGRTDRDNVVAKSQMHDRERAVVRKSRMGRNQDCQQRDRERDDAQVAHGVDPPR